MTQAKSCRGLRLMILYMWTLGCHIFSEMYNQEKNFVPKKYFPFCYIIFPSFASLYIQPWPLGLVEKCNFNYLTPPLLYLERKFNS